MKCRRIHTHIDEAGYSYRDVVWFGSYGKNADGTAKFYNDKDKHDNYSQNEDAIADSLTQKLSVLKNELWYNINFGLPLLEKTSKGIIDSYIVEICLKHPDVKSFKKFKSIIKNNDYACVFTLDTKYGDLKIDI